MKRFFDDALDLDRFSYSLKDHPHAPTCQHCGESQQWVSHGYVYKKQPQAKKIIVGKRLICSKRYGHLGCGRTFRLYLKVRIPQLVYDATSLMMFWITLLSNMSISDAYQQATQTEEPRHAYRWIKKFQDRLSEYHTQLFSFSKHSMKTFQLRCHRLQIILPTIEHLRETLGKAFCQSYQVTFQRAFL